MMVIKGWIYCLLWYFSILSGYVGLFCPLFPLLFISNKLYRYVTDFLFTFWQYYPTALLEMFCGCDIQVTGDPIQTEETSIIIMNHRTRTDWNFLWPTVYHCVSGKNRYRHSSKFVLKDVIRHIPGPGWVMQLACFVYIRRCWIYDKQVLKKYANYVSDLSYKHSLIVFPEGTDFTPSTMNNSHKFAEKNNLQKYEYVLHPRTTGFTYLAHQLLSQNALDAVYDVTLIYPDVIPQNEKLLFSGHFPKEVKIHFVRYPSAVLPKSEDGLKDFLERRWLDKEKTIKEFKATGQFLHGQVLKQDRPLELYLALIFWTSLPYITLFCFVYLESFRYLVIAHTIFLLLVNLLFGGFQNFEISLYNFKKRLFK